MDAFSTNECSVYSFSKRHKSDRGVFDFCLEFIAVVANVCHNRDCFRLRVCIVSNKRFDSRDREIGMCVHILFFVHDPISIRDTSRHIDRD